MVRNGVTEMTLGRLKKYMEGINKETRAGVGLVPLFSLACP